MKSTSNAQHPSSSQSAAAKRRHPNIANVDEIPATEATKGTRYALERRSLAREAGGRDLGCTWYRVPAGKTAVPHHYHCLTEEAIFILEGEGTLRLGDDQLPVRSGDWISLRTGPAHPHQLLNTSSQPLTYLCVSTQVSADVVGYPDSKKIAALASSSPSYDSSRWVRGIFREASGVDYFDGENTD